MKKIDREKLETQIGSRYPAPFDEPCRARKRVRLAKATGVTQFGVNELTIPPGAWSSQRHWHHTEDEFVMVLRGEVVLITNAGEEVLHAGDAAGFPCGVADGHHFVNRSNADVVLMEVGSTKQGEIAEYSDIDMRGGAEGMFHRDGTPYKR
jgi:uncharacterized cupin superfamily protein